MDIVEQAGSVACEGEVIEQVLAVVGQAEGEVDLRAAGTFELPEDQELVAEVGHQVLVFLPL